MLPEEVPFLVLVVVAFVAFGGVLAYASATTRNRDDR